MHLRKQNWNLLMSGEYHVETLTFLQVRVRRGDVIYFQRNTLAFNTLPFRLAALVVTMLAAIGYVC
jgi:hypothetical protein